MAGILGFFLLASLVERLATKKPNSIGFLPDSYRRQGGYGFESEFIKKGALKIPSLQREILKAHGWPDRKILEPDVGFELRLIHFSEYSWKAQIL